MAGGGQTGDLDIARDAEGSHAGPAGGGPGGPGKVARLSPGGEHPESESRRGKLGGRTRGGSGADPGEAHEWVRTISKLMLGQSRQTS